MSPRADYLKIEILTLALLNWQTYTPLATLWPELSCKFQVTPVWPAPFKARTNRPLAE